MQVRSKDKIEHLKKVSTSEGIISALAIDQRSSIRKSLTEMDVEIDSNRIEDFKALISSEMTKYTSSILLDPEYGQKAAREKYEGAGLIMAYEVTGFDKDEVGRLPHLLKDWSVKRLKELGADAIKILLYYDVDEDDEINNQKKVFVERIGSECDGEGLPFFLEIISYDANLESIKGLDYAKVKPKKVNEAVKVFSEDRYHVDVLKLEVPVNMDFVEGYATGEVAYTRQEALDYFKEQSDATNLPFIFLSAGVSSERFRETLEFAHEAESQYNGVLCGRATWKDSLPIFMLEGKDEAYRWVHEQGKENLHQLNEVVEKTAKPWTEKMTERNE